MADLRESSDTTAVTALVSYQLVQHIASQAAQQATITAATHWQFRVLLLPPYTALINDGNTLQADADPHAVLRSPVLPWQGT